MCVTFPASEAVSQLPAYKLSIVAAPSPPDSYRRDIRNRLVKDLQVNGGYTEPP